MTYDEWMAEVENRISAYEGSSFVKYFDDRGVATIGKGFNLQRSDADSILKSVRTSLVAVNAGVPLTQAQVDAIFKRCLLEAMAAASTSVVGYPQLSDARRFVVVDLVYNMGITQWMEFAATRSIIEQAIVATDANTKHALFGEAADHLENSDWYGQVGDRAVADVAMMRSSNWV